MSEQQGWGGARPGAGRKPKAEKYAPQITALEDTIADSLPARYEAMDALAQGGKEQISEVWEPAGMQFVGSGENRTPAFPHLPPEQLVCIRRTVTTPAPDRRANEYLINRILGTPVQQIEGKLEQETTLPPALEAMIAKAYGAAEDASAEGA